MTDLYRDPFQGPAQPIAPELPPWDGPRHGRAPRPWWHRRVAWVTVLAVLAVIAAVALLAVKGGNAAPSGATAANVKACRSYLTQIADAKRAASGDMAKVAAMAPKLLGQIEQDARQATQGTAIGRDLNALEAGLLSNGPAHNPDLIPHDCAAIGVKASKGS